MLTAARLQTHFHGSRMPHLFVHGSLKQVFSNQHVNTGRRVPGQFRTWRRAAAPLDEYRHGPCGALLVAR